MKRSQSGPRSVVISAMVVAVMVALWFALTPQVIPELVFPSPPSVWEAVVSLDVRLISHSIHTLSRVLAGWVIGTSVGIATGLLMTRSRVVYAISHPLIEALRPIPPVALIPFFIIWFGLGPVGQIALVALACFMVLVISTYVAVENLNPVYVRAASTLGATNGQVYLTVILPGILPALVSAFRVAAALAFGVGVAAEFMGAQSGLGFLIMVARRTLNTNTILLGTILIGIESYLVDLGIRAAARYFCRWSESPLQTIQQLGEPQLGSREGART